MRIDLLQDLAGPGRGVVAQTLSLVPRGVTKSYRSGLEKDLSLGLVY